MHDFENPIPCRASSLDDLVKRMESASRCVKQRQAEEQPVKFTSGHADPTESDAEEHQNHTHRSKETHRRIVKQPRAHDLECNIFSLSKWVVVPVPEASTVLASVLLLGVIGWRERRIQRRMR